mgnify:CR=1 FL=1
MIFGEKYYGMLKKLSPWRQSLFSLVLAQRQYPNYALWCDGMVDVADSKGELRLTKRLLTPYGSSIKTSLIQSILKKY